MNEEVPSLVVVGLSKSFGSSRVLHGVDLTVHRGTIHALIGQNGAGKSTLVKTLAGLYPDHEGSISVDGHRVVMRNPRQARKDGIAVIHQEFSLVAGLDVAENLLLGREPGRWHYHPATIQREAAALVEKVGIDLGAALSDPTDALSPAVHQRIEIVKALAEDARVLVMDEPTARLAEAERADLFALMRELSTRGVGIIFISHYLDEVRSVTDTTTVMRNGAVITTRPTADLTVETMAALMLGEELAGELREHDEPPADDDHEILLEGRALSIPGRLESVDVRLRRGEILGVAGLVGSGRTRLCRLLAGADTAASGSITYKSQTLRSHTPRTAVQRGIMLIPEDRKHQALSMEASLSQNLVLMAVQRVLGRWGFVSRRAVRTTSRDLLASLQVRPADPGALAGSHSGGNQQKIVLGKVLAAHPEVLLVDQPTAGVDVGTKAQIHQLLRERARAGAAVFVVSDDLEELYGLGDRFQVLHRGRTVWTGKAHEVDYDSLLHAIATAKTPRAL